MKDREYDCVVRDRLGRYLAEDGTWTGTRVRAVRVPYAIARVLAKTKPPSWGAKVVRVVRLIPAIDEASVHALIALIETKHGRAVGGARCRSRG